MTDMMSESMLQFNSAHPKSNQSVRNMRSMNTYNTNSQNIDIQQKRLRKSGVDNFNVHNDQNQNFGIRIAKKRPMTTRKDAVNHNPSKLRLTQT